MRRGEQDEEVPQRVQCDKRQKFKQNERVPMTPSFGLVWLGLVEFGLVCCCMAAPWGTGQGRGCPGACDDVDVGGGKWLS